MGDHRILHTSCVYLSAINMASGPRALTAGCPGWQDGAGSLEKSRSEQKKIRARESSLE